MWFMKLLLIGVFVLICVQDYKDRLVYWYYYAIVGALAFVLHISAINTYSALLNVVVNFTFVAILILVSYLYAKFRLKKPFLNGVIGTGDLLLFFALSFTFSILSFFVIFVFSLIFSLLLHLYLKQRQADPTVPLAGYMSLFFATIYALSFIPGTAYLYAY